MTVSNILGSVLFGSIGFVAFIYGKKMASFRPMAIGAGLMIYPYFITNTAWMYAIGVLLTVGLFLP